LLVHGRERVVGSEEIVGAHQRMPLVGEMFNSGVQLRALELVGRAHLVWSRVWVVHALRNDPDRWQWRPVRAPAAQKALNAFPFPDCRSHSPVLGEECTACVQGLVAFGPEAFTGKLPSGLDVRNRRPRRVDVPLGDEVLLRALLGFPKLSQHAAEVGFHLVDVVGAHVDPSMLGPAAGVVAGRCQRLVNCRSRPSPDQHTAGARRGDDPSGRISVAEAASTACQGMSVRCPGVLPTLADTAAIRIPEIATDCRLPGGAGRAIDQGLK
jgi:hypothetical protein